MILPAIMSQAELLALVIENLNELQIPHMLVGSFASSFYGEARSTHDIDVVIDLAPTKIQMLVARFDPKRYYLSEAALREGRMANLIDTMTGDKVDCFLLDKDPVNLAAFARRSPQKIMNVTANLASVEDTILAKIRWSEMSGGLPRQQADVREMMRVQVDRLDITYLRRQSKLMKLEFQLDRLLEEFGLSDAGKQ